MFSLRLTSSDIKSDAVLNGNDNDSEIDLISSDSTLKCFIVSSCFTILHLTVKFFPCKRIGTVTIILGTMYLLEDLTRTPKVPVSETSILIKLFVTDGSHIMETRLVGLPFFVIRSCYSNIFCTICNHLINHIPNCFTRNIVKVCFKNLYCV